MVSMYNVYLPINRCILIDPKIIFLQFFLSSSRKKKNETNSVVIELQNNEYILFLRYQLPLFRNNRFLLDHMT